MSEETLNVVRFFRRRLQTATKRITLAGVAHGAAVSVGIAGAALFVAVAVEAGFWVATLPRSIGFWLWVAVTLAVAARFVMMPALRLTGLLPGPSEDSVAKTVGLRSPEVGDRLVNLLHLADGRRSHAPAPLVDEAVRQLGSGIHDTHFRRVEDFAAVKRVGPAASVPAVCLLIFLVAAPSTFMGASMRLFSPGAAFVRPAPFEFRVEPGSVDLVRGADLQITVQATGRRLPGVVTLEMSALGEDRVETKELKADPSGHFAFVVTDVRSSFRYRLTATPVASDWFAARVESRPIVSNLDLTLRPPAYTGLPEEHLAPHVGDVLALPGTRVDVRAQTGGNGVAKALLLFDTGKREALDLHGASASGGFTVRQEDAYRIQLTSDHGVENADPIRHSVKLLSDSPPSATLLEPEPAAELDASLEALLRIRVRDDFGFSRLALFYRLAESRFSDIEEDFRTIGVEIEAGRRFLMDIAYSWPLGPTTRLDIVPGDAIEYFVRVWDNDVWAGFKSADSELHRLSLPSLAERYAELASAQDAAEDEMEDLLGETESVRKEFDALRDELRQKQSADWDDNRQLARLKDKQNQLEERIDDLAGSLESAIDTMEDHDLVSDATLEAFEELQRVMEEINAPELMEALQELQKAMQELSPRLMQESIENFEFNEEMFRERLERSLELFKRLHVQQLLEEAARRADELAAEQKRLAEETQAADDDDSERLAEEQMRSGDSMESLEERLEEIERRMNELRNAPSEEMDRLNEETRQQEIPERMRENAAQLQELMMAEAWQGQLQMQQQLDQLQGALEDVQSGMEGQRQQANMALLSRVVADILRLSYDQESVRQDVEIAAQDSPLFREFARRQVALSDGLGTVTDSLRSLSRELAHMTREVQRQAGESLRAMTEATTALAERETQRAVAVQDRSMMHLNELALLLSDLMEQLMNASNGSAGGGMSMERMLEQLQQMAGEQQQLNERIQQMLEEMQGSRLSPNMQQRLQQMGAQQQALRDRLREMNRRQDLAGRLAGDLGRIAEQMNETIEELQRGAVNPRTVMRQQEIITRLLDASRSLQERGRERRREGQTGEDIPREGPDELAETEQVDELRRALLQALESGYSPDWRELIRRYFELLQQRQ